MLKSQTSYCQSIILQGLELIKFSGGSKVEFTTKDFMKKANNVIYQEATIDNLITSMWVHLTSPTVEFFMWLALLGELNTKDLLHRKGILPVVSTNAAFVHKVLRISST